MKKTAPLKIDFTFMHYDPNGVNVTMGVEGGTNRQLSELKRGKLGKEVLFNMRKDYMDKIEPLCGRRSGEARIE